MDEVASAQHVGPDEAHLRRAAQLAVDRDAPMRAAFQGMASPGDGHLVAKQLAAFLAKMDVPFSGTIAKQAVEWVTYANQPDLGFTYEEMMYAIADQLPLVEKMLGANGSSAPLTRAALIEATRPLLVTFGVPSFLLGTAAKRVADVLFKILDTDHSGDLSIEERVALFREIASVH